MRFLLLSLICIAFAFGLASALGRQEGAVSRLLGRDVAPTAYASAGAIDVREPGAAPADAPSAPAVPTPEDDSTEDDVGDDIQDEFVAVLATTAPEARGLTRMIEGTAGHARRDSSLVGRSRESPEAPPPRA